MRTDLGGQYPGKFGRIVLSALEEVVGRNGLLAVLRLGRLGHWSEAPLPDDFRPAVSFEEMGSLFAALDELYGPTEGEQLAQRAGRRLFREGARDLGFMLGVADVGRRVLPLSVRIRLGMETMAEIFNRYSDHRVVLREDRAFYYWVSESCGLCHGRRTTYPACGLMTGLLSATMSWLSVGRVVEVEEVACIAQGAETCTFRVPKVRTGRRRDDA